MPAAPAATSDGSERARQLGFTQADGASPYQFKPYESGDEVRDQVSLDMCGKDFKSEANRTARHQVGIIDGQSDDVVSTEAIAYRNAPDAAAALQELRDAAATCPSTPVTSPVEGVPPLTFRFGPPPDTGWSVAPSVDRAAFDVTMSTSDGQSQHSVAVYQRRGRFLLALYVQQPDLLADAVTGRPTLSDLSKRMADQLAAIPAGEAGG
jgi:hypothetical protein